MKFLSTLACILSMAAGTASAGFWGPGISSDGTGIFTTIKVGNNPKSSVDGAVLLSSGSVVIQSTSASAGHFTLQTRDNTGTATFHVQQDGKVGVGTVSPGTKLEVLIGGTHVAPPVSGITLQDTQNASIVGITVIAGTSGQASLVMGTVDNKDGGAIVYEGKNMLFRVDDSTMVVFEDGGNVGIGITNPVEALDVVGGIGLYSRTKSQLEGITPGKAGTVYFCSDCSNSVHMVISTGTAVSQFDSAGVGGTAWH